MHAYSRTQTPNISIKFSLTKEHNKENLPSLFVDHCAFFFFFWGKDECAFGKHRMKK